MDVPHASKDDSTSFESNWEILMNSSELDDSPETDNWS